MSDYIHVINADNTESIALPISDLAISLARDPVTGVPTALETAYDGKTYRQTFTRDGNNQIINISRWVEVV